MKLKFENDYKTQNISREDLKDLPSQPSEKHDQMLQDGIEAAQSGDRAEARHLLMRAAEEDPQSESAWLWLASISEYPEELLVFLNKVLAINPENERALDWAKETKSLLANTFVQKGADAEEADHKEFAKQCFLQAIVYDEDSEAAWMRLSSVSDPLEEKIACFKKVLEINPDNAAAQTNIASLNTIVEKANNKQTDESLKPVGENVLIESENLKAETGKKDDDESGKKYQQVQKSVLSQRFGSAEDNFAYVFKDRELQTAADVLDPLKPKDIDKNIGCLDCPYCKAENVSEAFRCGNCNSALSLFDIEMLFSNTNVKTEIVEQAVKEMEEERKTAEYDAGQVKILALGYINLKRFRQGYECLKKASKLDAEDFMLMSQLDAFAIRLAEIERAEKASYGIEAKTIVVVDDSYTIRKLISGKLEESGFNVVCAVDGIHAIAVLKTVTPDLILLDIAMPRMDGYEVCRQIREKERVKNVPIVMISGRDGIFDKALGKIAGSTDYIAKPFGPETLMRTINKYI